MSCYSEQLAYERMEAAVAAGEARYRADVLAEPDEPINYSDEPWDCQPSVDGYSRQDGDLR